MTMKAGSGAANNIRKLTHAQRKALGEGESVKILVGDDSVGEVSIGMMLAVSTKARKETGLLQQDRTVHLPTEIAKGPVRHILDWMNTNITSKEYTPLESRMDMKMDLMICRAARYLGIDPMYDDAIAGYWMHSLHCTLPNPTELTLIEAVALDKTDPFLIAAARRMANARYHGELKNPETFEQFLTENPKLYKAIEDYEAPLIEARIKREESEKAKKADMDRRRRVRERREAAEAKFFKKLEDARDGCRTLTEEQENYLLCRQ